MASDSGCPEGHSNPPGAKFCRICGAGLGQAFGRGATPPGLGDAGTFPPKGPGVAGAVPPFGKDVVPPTFVPPGGSSPVSSDRKKWSAIVIVVLALIVVGLGSAFAVTVFSNKSAARRVVFVKPQRSVTSTTISNTTTSPASQEQAEAQALNTLLENSAQDRSQITAAVQQITSCGDLAGAQQTLDQAASSRQQLLSQLNQVQLGALSNSRQLILSLQSAWQASFQSDNSYAAYAGDELTNFGGCTPNDSGDPNAQAAAISDSQATAAKTQFVNIWDSIASQFGLPQWQASQL